ncbi:MAG TPA: efflux RND transporter periplasmic adaptor subunit, partial [Ignavibacteria bacterium]
KVENNTRTLLLRAICNNPQRKLLPGTFAEVTLKLSENKSAILIPTQALVPKLKGQSVYVVKEGKAKLIDVEIGERTEEAVQITSGNINPGDTVITTNILRLKNDAAVKIIKVQ